MHTSSTYFQGKSLLVATRHGKEKVLGPLFAEKLGVHCLEVPPIDTDRLGTFSGETERPGDMLETAQLKAALGYEACPADLVLVSEGSFGPHPAIPFIASDLELLYMVESETGRFWRSDYLSTDTNFTARRIENLRDLRDFAQEIGFPEHGIILKASQHDFSTMYKGLQEKEALEQAAKSLWASHGSVWAETDMRAHLNPTRMEVLAKAGAKMIDRLQASCPNCLLPGFAGGTLVAGLPCAWCQRPTRLPLYENTLCNFCSHSEKHMHPHGSVADPSHCDYCNP